jgi:hypothetical protein
MKFGKRVLFLLPLFFFIHQLAYSQEHCATVQYEELRKLRNPKKESTEGFENWIKNKLDNRRFDAQRAGEANQTQSTYTIPVVVHVIHNGEPIGTGLNISDAQIQSQIEVLNKDYKRLNIDAVNTPSEFLPVAGSIDIEFVLAKQDPIGAPTNGIVRVQGTQTSWTVNDNTVFKALSYWPAENYLNIWVIKFADSNIGYAQFPVSGLPGLEESSNDRLTDGVVVSYTAFGSIEYGNFPLDAKYNRGRTATHEIGHFLGLRHIWGDDGSACTESDYVEDTPNQGGSYLNQCPTTTRSSCSSNDMYMNYMDYTNDACMNLFTVGQIGRFNVVLQNSPRRASLLSSPGATAPVPAPNDAAISKIISPGSSSCGDPIIPMIEIKNIGSTNLFSVRVQLKINNIITETKDVSINLDALETADISFSAITPVSNSIIFSFEILLSNGIADGNMINNKQEITTTIPPLVSLPVSEIFNSIPPNWRIYNPDNLKTWQIVNTGINGNSLFLNAFDYENQGAIDQVITPVLDLTNVSIAFLRFDRAYALYDNEFFERLRVLVSSECDFNNTPAEVFNLSGSALATAPTSTNYFSPAADQWKTEFISLSQFIGKKVQIAFEATNGYGNNLYLDNVAILSDAFIDLAIESLVRPSPVSCETSISPLILLKNNGTITINSVNVRILANSQNPIIQSFNNLTIAPGGEAVIAINSLALQAGLNNLSFTLQNPNGNIDANPANDVLARQLVINNEEDIIPYRENFNASYQKQWSIVSNPNELVWKNGTTNYSTSMLFNAFNYPKSGEESWLVSPVLDFSGTTEASMFFDVSYAYRFIENEGLRVLYSDDCGITFNNVLYNKTGSTLSTTTTSVSWVPSEENQWRKEYIDLTSLAGKSNLRFAFVATEYNGNNLYVDNIEFFIDNNPEPVFIKNTFSVYGVINDVRLTFNLKERQPVTLQIYNSVGQAMLNNTLPETLNQTYYFDLQQFSSGIYIFKVTMGNEVGVARVYLGR